VLDVVDGVIGPPPTGGQHSSWAQIGLLQTSVSSQRHW
jgi:hypothetical protein